MNPISVTLIAQVPAAPDADGYSVAIGEKRTKLLATPKSATRSEFYAAAKAGFKPAGIYEVYAWEYCAAAAKDKDRHFMPEHLEAGGVLYKILRTFQKGLDKMELTCEEVTR